MTFVVYRFEIEDSEKQFVLNSLFNGMPVKGVNDSNSAGPYVCIHCHRLNELAMESHRQNKEMQIINSKQPITSVLRLHH